MSTDDHPPIANPRPLQKALASLRKAQRRLERRTRRDKNRRLLPRQSWRREKARVLLAKAHLRVARARADFHHKLARALVNRFSILYVEHLNIAGMLQNPSLARHIMDVGWGSFLAVLRAKAQRAGRTVVEVSPYRTSQNCCSCGQYVPKALLVRIHSCPYCGLVVHRDKNAAEHIKKVGRDAALGRERRRSKVMRGTRTKSTQALAG